MRCLKCGSNVEHPHVFCPSCIEKMNACPVSRETPVVILPRPKSEPVRPRTVKPEELLALARRRQKVLAFFCILLLTLTLALGGLVFWLATREDKPTGQNYTPNVVTQDSNSTGGTGE